MSTAPLDTRPRAEARPQTALWRAVLAIVWKDLASEWRSRELLSSMMVFALAVLFIFNFALELDARTRTEVIGGMLWSTFTFAGTLGLNRSMAAEKDRGALDGLLLAPMDRSAIYLGKVLANWLFMLAMAGLVLPLVSMLYNQNLFRLGLLGVIVLGSLGYVAVGTLLAAMAVQARTRDMLLPILLLPLVLPVLIPAVRASMGFLRDLPWADFASSVHLLVTTDIIFLAVGYMLFDAVMAE